MDADISSFPNRIIAFAAFMPITQGNSIVTIPAPNLSSGSPKKESFEQIVKSQARDSSNAPAKQAPFTAAMVKVAETLLEIKPKQISFDEIDEHDFYDAIWANFSLLHIKKNKLSDILRQLFFALKKEGILFFSLKRGMGESRDKLGRFYSYYEKTEVEKLLEKASFRTRTFSEGASIGLAGEKENWMGFFCEKIR